MKDDDYDYGYGMGFLSPEILEDYEDQTVEEYYRAHPDKIPQEAVMRRKSTKEDNYEDKLIEDPLAVMEARIDYLIAELEAGRIPGNEPQAKVSAQTISSQRKTNSKKQHDSIWSIVVLSAIIFIIAMIIIMCD